MRNKFAQECYRCGVLVPAGDGFFERIRGKGWQVRHANCKIK